MLGHAHPQVVAAMIAQSHHGTHHGACHVLEVAWAERIQRLVPSAELTRCGVIAVRRNIPRFTASGTEATHLALRIARAATGDVMRD